MILNRRKRRHSLGFVMTPMIDIVFLLIIFFMTVSQATQVMEQPLPLARVAQGTEATRPSTLTVNLDGKGQLIIAGKVVSIDSFMDELRKTQRTDSGDRPPLHVKLRVHRDCPSQEVNRVARVLARQGIQSVRIAVMDESGDEAGERP